MGFELVKFMAEEQYTSVFIHYRSKDLTYLNLDTLVSRLMSDNFVFVGGRDQQVWLTGTKTTSYEVTFLDGGSDLIMQVAYNLPAPQSSIDNLPKPDFPKNLREIINDFKFEKERTQGCPKQVGILG
jgi:hypothetical protein